MGKLSRLYLRGLVMWLLLCPLHAISATYQAYNTYLYPPFVNPDGSGLAADVVALLNRHMGADRFELVNVPRARLLALLNSAKQDMNGIGLFLVPEFVDQRLPPGRFAWSAPLFSDSNVLIFRASPPAALPEGLKGLRFGSVRGNTYRYVDPLVARGLVKRDEGADEMGNLRKLLLGRIDFTQMNVLYFQALSAQTPGAQNLVAVAEPESHFERRILLPQRAPEALKSRLASVLAGLQQNSEWQKLAKNYSLSPPLSLR